MLAELLGDIAEDSPDLAFTPLEDILEPPSSGGAWSEGSMTAKTSVVVRPVFTVEQVETIERALGQTGLQNRGEALTAICEAYLAEA